MPVAGYPVSIILDGPAFSDELRRQPQDSLDEHDIDSLRLVPSKSAAHGVHKIYFKPVDREWALVRLALRYRWILEVQLNRGMSGERQLIRQGLTPDDLEFLFEIVPQPPRDFSPIVYDMLWLVATYDEYLSLTRSMLEQGVFTPGKLLDETDKVNRKDSGFITRFLRSHLIEQEHGPSEQARRRGKSKRTDLSVDLDATYLVTTNGAEALEGILHEYERIFEGSQFESLYINPDLDPHQHLREFGEDDSYPASEMELDDIRESDGLLGEIAESFMSVETKADDVHEESSGESSAASQTRQEPTEAPIEPKVHNPKQKGYPLEPNEAAPSIECSPEGRSDADPSEDTPGELASYEGGNRGPPDEFNRDEIVDAALSAASIIHEERMIQTGKVKEQAWKSVELREREKSELWKSVALILDSMDDIHGRPGGGIWLSTR